MVRPRGYEKYRDRGERIDAYSRLLAPQERDRRIDAGWHAVKWGVVTLLGIGVCIGAAIWSASIPLWPVVFAACLIGTLLLVARTYRAFDTYLSKPCRPEAEQAEAVGGVQMSGNFRADSVHWLNPYLHDDDALREHRLAQVRKMGTYSTGDNDASALSIYLNRRICVWQEQAQQAGKPFKENERFRVCHLSEHPGPEAEPIHIRRVGKHFVAFFPAGNTAQQPRSGMCVAAGRSFEAGGNGDCLFYAAYYAKEGHEAIAAQVQDMRDATANNLHIVFTAPDGSTSFRTEAEAAYHDWCTENGWEVAPERAPQPEDRRTARAARRAKSAA